MMDNYETHRIDSCKNCPFRNEDYLMCMHPRHLPEMRETTPNYKFLTPEQSSGIESPPSWCPMRSASLLIDLQTDDKKNHIEKRITQTLVDNVFSCFDGFGRLTYALDGCRLIQRFIQEAHGVHLSLAECQRFWRWRSDLWEASFLTVHDHEESRAEVLDYFQKWLDELDIWDWANEEKETDDEQ